MKVKELIKELNKLNQDKNIVIASDEEWNSFFRDFEIGIKNSDYIIFGLSGSEVNTN